MKKGLVYKYVFGKEQGGDFTADALPASRMRQFFVLLRSRFGVLFRASLLCAPFWLPLLAWDMLCGWYVGELTQGMTVAERFSYLLNLTLLQYGTDALLLGLALVGASGVFYVCRRLCWGQHVKILGDFFNGVKNSGKQFFTIGLVLGAFCGLMKYLSSVALLTMTEDNSFAWTVAVCLCVTAVVIATAIAVLACGQASLYNVSARKLLLNSTIMTFKKLFKSLLIVTATILPFIVAWMLPWVLSQLIVCCVLIVCGLSCAALAQTEFCLDVFDELINKRDYPDFVNMGLRGGKSYLQAQGANGSTTTNANGNDAEQGVNLPEVVERTPSDDEPTA